MTDRSSPHRPRRGNSRGASSSGSGGGFKKPRTHARGPAAEPLHPTAEPPDIPTFRHWELGDEVQSAIAGMGIEVPTPIQRLAIGPVLEGRDVIAKAETGTGKTLAFGAPIIAKLDPARSTVLALVLCPTRELAQQVASTLEVLGNAKGLKTALVVGGEPMQAQVQALQKGAQVVVGTPGRVLDLYGQRFLSFPWTEFVVLDEADEMLEIGFIDDVKKILGFTPDERQTLLFSATFPAELLALARESTRNPAEIATAAGVATVKSIEQSWFSLDRDDRALGLIRLIEQSAPEDVFLVFCDRRTEVDSLMRRLQRLPFSIKALHGGYDQPSRFRVMGAFRTGEVKALVATDVASRGLDVLHVTHVVNYSVPHDLSTYTHRIGRTGRAGRKGAAITIVSSENAGRWRDILNAAPWEIPQMEPPGPGGPRGRPSHSYPPREVAREPERARETTREPAREAREPERKREPERREPTRRPEAHPAREAARPARAEAPQVERAEVAQAKPKAKDGERPRRALSTRERLRQEREGGAKTDSGKRGHR
ncbi:MAG TPA: DEAD/DEAH box helicase [Planctomycetota bacterium]|nr:DEAD/DEAH box helicase [Planctomycetota bacterium]